MKIEKYTFYNKYADINIKIQLLAQLGLGEFLQNKITNIPGISYLQSSADKYEIETIFTDKKIYIKLFNKEYIFQSKIHHSDLYVIFNALIYASLLRKKLLCIHSACLSKNNKGILIIGDFHSGKTTLSIHLEKLEWIQESTDQTIIKTNSPLIEKICGSNYMKYSNKNIYINKYNSALKQTPISKIIFIKGLCENGLQSVENIKSKSRIMFDLYKAMTWPFHSPLINSGEFLHIPIELNDFYTHAIAIYKKCDFLSIRGDPAKIANYINGLYNE